MALPKLIETLVHSGYTAASGNRMTLLVAEKPVLAVAQKTAPPNRTRLSIVANWKRKPSAADKAEIQQILEACANVEKTADFHNTPHEEIARQIREYLG